MNDPSRTSQDLLDENASLKQRIRELEEWETERRLAEEVVNKYSLDLRERVKELNCVYAVSDLIRRKDISWETMLLGCTSLLSQAYQFPEITECRITWGDQEYTTENFKRTAWLQSRAIIVRGGQVGTVEVCYLEERQNAWEGPFLAEERRLLNAVAELLGKSAECTQTEEALREARQESRTLLETLSGCVWEIDSLGRYTYVSPQIKDILGYEPDEILGTTPYDLMLPEESKRVSAIVGALMRAEKPILALERITIHKDGHPVVLEMRGRPFFDADGILKGYRGADRDVTGPRRTEAALEKRIVALTRPLDDVEGIDYEDLFDLPELQRLQDLTAKAWGVGALITRPDGTPITQPSSFTYLCSEFIRTTGKGSERCRVSDAMLGRHNPSGPIIRQCMSAGLWGAGASITVGGRHIANWLIGQVRNEAQSEERIMEYAREIGADEAAFREAFLKVPVMAQEKFNEIAHALFALANQLAVTAYQNIQQARFIAERKRTENALKESEERFRELAELLPIAVFEIDLKGSLTYGNNKAFDIFGYTPDNVPDRLNVFDMMAPDDRDRALRNARRIVDGEDMGPNEYVLRRSDGTTFPATIHSAAIIREGRAVGLRGAVADITDAKKAEEALRLSHQRILDIIEFLPDATFVIDHEKRVVAWNKAIEEMTGVKKGEMIGKGDHAYAVPFYGKARPIVIDLVLESDEEGTRGYDFVERQGDILLAEVHVPLVHKGKGAFLSVRASPLFDQEGNVVGAIESIRDITDEKRIVRELQESEERYRTAIESSNDGVAMIRDGHLFYVNRKFLETFGFDSISQVVGQSVGFMVHPDDRERVVELSRRRENDEEAPSQYEFKGTKKNGDVVFIEVSATRTTYKGEAISLVYLRDVTGRKHLEVQLRQSQNLESIGTLAGGIAHDFNNLLMTLVGNISLAKMHLSPGDRASPFLEEAERMSLAGADLTKRLITFAKGGTSVPKAISVNMLVRKSADAVAGSHIRCEYSLPDDPLTVKADEAQLRQVIHNILLNAKEAMPRGGTIKLSGTTIAVTAGDMLPLSSGDYVKITVEDEGRGISEEDLRKIFDPYFTTKGMGAARGMGLGLAVVYSVVKRHNGHIAVESMPGKGTTVHIYLPSYKATEGSGETTAGVSASSQGKVLFMDDERTIRDVCEKILVNLGYKVELAADGMEAVERYRSALGSDEPFDAVILDLVVKGGMGGQEAMRTLLSLDPHVKAVVCSGYTDDPVISDYADYGFKAVLAKPHRVDELKGILQRIIPHPKDS